MRRGSRVTAAFQQPNPTAEPEVADGGGGYQNGCLVNLTGHFNFLLSCLSGAEAVLARTRRTEEETRQWRGVAFRYFSILSLFVVFCQLPTGGIFSPALFVFGIFVLGALR